MSYVFQPNAVAAIVSSNTTTLNVNNATGSIVMFTITGTIQLLKIYGVVTTALSSNVTAAFLRLNDQTATVDMTLNTGVTLSSATVGSSIVKKGLVGAALVFNSNATGTYIEPTTLETEFFEEGIVQKKTGATTTIDFRYTTTNAPSTGAIQWFLVWQPLSADAAVA